ELEVAVGDRGDRPVPLDQALRLEHRGAPVRRGAACAGFRSRHTLTFRIHWPIATASSTRMPIAKPCQTTSTPASCSPLRNTPTIRAPTSVPSTIPRPPNRLGPPHTPGG